MKALDHYAKAERLERQQATLDPIDFSEVIISIAHGIAHHYVCAALEWLGDDPQIYGHAHGKHPTHLKAAGVPGEVLTAWDQLERLRAKAAYGGATTPVEAITARGYLSTLEVWAKHLHP
jgi:hypothetical protein